MLRFSALLAVAFLLTACAPTAVEPTPGAGGASDAAACAQQGGVLKPVGRLQSLQCIVSYRDAGRACTSGEQCEGDCRVPDGRTLQAGQPAAGVCQATSDRFGCHTTVENGVAEPTLCID